MIACVYRMSRTNVGDKACCPADYLDFGDIVKVDVASLDSEPTRLILRDADSILLGGGGVFYFEQSVANMIDAHGPKTVVWGAGANCHGSRTQTYPNNLKKCALVGLRDDCDVWVPCASCLSPLFDKYRGGRSDHDVIMYEHKSFPMLPERFEWPRLRNNATLDEALQFLSSGRVVVTNSFHGAYWATLLNRRCVIYQPFSSKFYRMKWQPPIAYTPEDLTDALGCRPSDERDPLRLSRERTMAFREQAMRVFARLG